MKSHTYYQFIPRSVDEVFSFFSTEKNLEKITPPSLNFHIVGKNTPELQKGTRINYRLKLYGMPIRWESLIEDWQPGKFFSDRQTKGPYRYWLHTHFFIPMQNGTLMVDQIDYQVPGGILGDKVVGPLVTRDVEKIFAYRKKVIKETFRE